MGVHCREELRDVYQRSVGLGDYCHFYRPGIEKIHRYNKSDPTLKREHEATIIYDILPDPKLAD